MLKVEGLTKIYGERTAIENVSFEVQEGEVVGFLGPNGAGKSTTIRILSGYLPATRGRALIDGHDILTDSLRARQQLGNLPESNPLYLDLPVRYYLEYMATLRGIPRKQRKAEVDRVIERCWLTDRVQNIIGKLSKGYRQRVGLAQALLGSPSVLLLDEPTDGLDPRQRVETRKLIRELGKDHTVLMASHILGEVEKTCDRVIIIHQGHIVAEESPSDLAHRLARSQTTRLEVAVRGSLEEIRERVLSLAGVVAVEASDRGSAIHLVCDIQEEGVGETVVAALVQGGFGVLAVKEGAPSLEESFLQLVGTALEQDPTSPPESP